MQLVLGASQASTSLAMQYCESTVRPMAKQTAPAVDAGSDQDRDHGEDIRQQIRWEDEPLPAYGSWLQQVASTVVGVPRRSPRPGDQAVIYAILISPACAWGVDLAVRIGAAQWLKNGSWGSERAIVDPCSPPDSLRNAFLDIDERLARNLRALSNSYSMHFHSTPTVHTLCRKAGSGDMLLEMVGTGRARMERGKIFSIGNERALRCSWRRGDELRERIAPKRSYGYTPDCDDNLWYLHAEVAEGLVILSKPALYIDLNKGLIGPLSGVDERAIDILHRAPGLATRDVQATHQLLKPLMPQLADPPPELNALCEGDEEDNDTTSAQAVFFCIDGTVTLNANSWNSNWQRPGQALLPLVGYGDVILPLQDRSPATYRDRDGMFRSRDLCYEQELRNQLSSLGLIRSHWDIRFTHANTDDARLKDEHSAFLYIGDLNPRSREPKSDRHGSFPLPHEILTRLRAAGWKQIDHHGQLHEPTVLRAETWQAVVEDGEESESGWFDLALGITVGDERIDALPLLRQLVELDEDSIRHLPRHGDRNEQRVLLGIDDDRLLSLPLDQVIDLYQTLLELFTRDQRGLRLSVWDFDAADAVARLSGGSFNNHRFQTLHHELRQLANRGHDAVSPPQGLQADLRPYQWDGVRWLQTLRRLGLGGLLADDMGLGKTVQTLAHLQIEHESGRLHQPALVIAPVSTLGNWRRECQRFTPDLSTHIHHGPQRSATWNNVSKLQVVITSYATLYRDQKHFAQQEWSVIVCDEAQALKNPNSQQGRAIRELRAGQRLALTGTPMENHLGELWSLMHWLEPGLLGSQAQFDRSIRKPIEKDGDRVRQQSLARRIAPVLLRRSKELVLHELPARTDIVHHLEMGREQSTLYESIRAAMDEQVRAAIAAKGLARSTLEFLEALLRLRQVCCHPPLIPTKRAQACSKSAKLDFLKELLPNLLEEGRRILLFSQFTSLLDHIAVLCQDLYIPMVRLDGRTRNRQAAIDSFQQGEVPLFLISLKAGGIGLNLTRADTVILTDPWWNPAIEQQAIDRAHRMGQTDPVFVHRLIIRGSVEERVVELQDKKRSLASGLYGDDGQALATLSDDDIAALLKPLESDS
ncbi:MAG: DEAD/DEAH box helicase [Planctomycetota bacterium]|nr:MAG: DEAD/DEAH box helicase [Planctomycetota bacterium]